MPLTDRAVVVQNGHVPTGLYQSAVRWVTLTGGEGTEAEGFVVTLRANPTNGTIQAISQPGSLWEDVGPFLAPLVKSWNATKEDVTFKEIPAELNEDGTERKPARKVVESIETVPLPAPSEGDWTVILQLDPPIREWILEQAILARFHVLAMNGETDKTPKGKESPAPSDLVPDGTPDGETMPTPMQSNRPRRKSSKTP
jgi:hypothetical protein